MLNQAELNFYGYNNKNIIQRARRGKITAVIRWDNENKFFIVTRATPRTKWEDRYKSIEDAKRRFYEFLYMTSAQLENKVFMRCV